MNVLFLVLTLILAQGKGFMVTPHDILPYWQAYTKSHGEPMGLLQKREILMNYLGDYLMVKRAKELGLDKTPQFWKAWNEAHEELQKRCSKEKVPEAKCKKMGEAIKKVLLIQMVIQKEVIPRIKITEEEIQQLILSHQGQKRGKKLDRAGAILFLQQEKKAKALNSYILDLMDRYKVKIDDKALEKLNDKALGLKPL